MLLPCVSIGLAQLVAAVRIGHGYAHTRREDPRIAASVHRALGDARTVVNVGAGTGSYEPRDRHVVAIEPSDVMASQRDTLRCVQNANGGAPADVLLRRTSEPSAAAIACPAPPRTALSFAQVLERNLLWQRRDPRLARGRPSR